MNQRTKTMTKILMLAITLILVVGAIVVIPMTASAATSTAGKYTISGSYDIGDGSVTGYKDDFRIEISTQYYSGDSTTTHYNGHIYNWTYFSFYIDANDVDEHTSFKLTRNGSTYTSKSLSGSSSGYLYQGALSDGDYVLTYVGKYWSNVISKKTYTYTYKFTVDTTAPSNSLKAGSSTISGGSYTNKAITYSYSDSNPYRLYYRSPGSSSYTYSTSTSKTVSATTANNGWWYFYAVDDGPNTGSTVSVYLDTVAPVGKITNSSGVTLASGSYTNKPVKYTATDTGGVSYLQVQTPGSSSWSSYSSGTALSSAEGWYYFRAVDKAGNISTTSSVYYDASEPIARLYAGTNAKSSGTYTNADTIKYQAIDHQSGLSKLYVKKPNSNNFVEYERATELKAVGTYYFYCEDLAGNRTDTVHITIDRTAPVGTLYGGTSTKVSGSYTNAAYVKYTAVDEKSGIQSLYVKIPGSDYFSAYTSGVQLTSEGMYQFYAVDKAGNQSTTVNLIVDRTKPTGAVYGGSYVVASGSATNAASVRFAPFDNFGTSQSFVKMPGSTSFVTYTPGVQLTDPGTYSFKTTDIAGNESVVYTVTIDRQAPDAELQVDGEVVGNGIFTCGDYISFHCEEKCYVKMPGTTAFVDYVSGTELNKPGKYVFYGQSAAGNSTGEFTIIIDRTIKEASVSNVTDGVTNGDVVISWEDADSDLLAPIVEVTVNGKPITNGATVHTIDTGAYTVKVVDAAGNEWQTSFASTKKNVLSDTLVKEFFEVPDIDGNLFAFTTYEKAFAFATARENSRVKTAEWTGSTWDGGVPMDTEDAANAQNGTYYVYYMSGNPDELVAYFTTERLNKVIVEYAAIGIESYYYFEKAPAAAGPDEVLYPCAADRNILAREVLLGDNIGVTVDGELFVGEVYDTEGKHEMIVADSFGNTCTYRLTVIRTTPALHYAIENGATQAIDLDRTYFFKDGITISITDELDEMAMFLVYGENGDLIGEYSLGETCTLTESGRYTAESVNHMGFSETFHIIISRNAPTVELKPDADAKQLVITAIPSIDDESEFRTLELYKSTDNGNTWVLLDTDDYGTAVELGTLVYKFRTSGMYRIILTDDFRTGMDAISSEIIYAQPAPVGTLDGVADNGHTNKEVSFTWTDEAKVTVTKDGETIAYASGDKLTADGAYSVIFENYDGYKTTYDFVIDTKVPEVAVEGHKADLPVKTPVTVNIVEEGATAVLIKNGKEVGAYESGTPVSEEGTYTIRVTDVAKNVTEVSFEIDTSVDFEANIYSGGLANSVTISGNEPVKIELTRDGTLLEYVEGKAITEPGTYSAKLTDELDNTAELTFTIVSPVYTAFNHSFDGTEGFETVIINEDETRLNYGALALTETGTYAVGVVVKGKTYPVTVVVDSSVDFTANVHDKGFANTVTVAANETVTMVATMNGEVMEYEFGTELTEPALYTFKMTDELGNTAEVSFTIIPALVSGFEQEIDIIPGFEKVLVNGEEQTLDKGTLVLKDTGTYEVTVVAGGVSHISTVVVDATAPTVTLDGVENGGATKGDVILTDLSEDAIMMVYLDEKLIEYTPGAKLTKDGSYKVVLTDAVGNRSEYTFEIEWSMSTGVIVLIVAATLILAGAGVWLFISQKRKNSYYNS